MQMQLGRRTFDMTFGEFLRRAHIKEQCTRIEQLFGAECIDFIDI
jgi:hypothetical protein